MNKQTEALKLALELAESAKVWRTGKLHNALFVPRCEETITAIREALAEQPAQQHAPGACTDEMCACRGGPCVSCPDGEREKELADVRDSRDFYKRRTDELQKAQSQMRDPERTMVCDILANGRLLVPAGGRYDTSPPASKPLTDEQIKSIYEDCDAPTGGQFTLAFARAIEAAHGIKGDA